MKVIEVFKQFNSNEKCIALLEKARWNKGISCPYCQSIKISRKAEKKQGTSARNARSLLAFLPERYFTAPGSRLSGFRFSASCLMPGNLYPAIRQQETWRLPSLIAWKIQNKIRKAMQTGESKLLKGIIEMDETVYRRKAQTFEGESKKGRGTDKTPVADMAECGGEIRTQVIK